MVRGYTLIELVVVILLVGILAAFIAPRIDFLGFRSAGFFQQSLASIRFAQKQVISSGCNVQVQIDTNGCALNWSGSCGSASITNPASGNTNFCADSSPIGTVSAVNFTFNRIGAPSAAQSFSVDSRTITVEANTGFSHEQ